ncbi:hypothetical protein JCGZ_09746 [Jatropha curcas]|uniref:BHLH domain-containing protein n=1 Tax=Jatropha curcas TaxID=180498 RepID=A0A067LAR0_JATCU|nr:transcription factor PRE3 [Jatropha curcas]KDP45497.1 hypothetical protein JCGZ_09746 [Jatropha curcas]
MSAMRSNPKHETEAQALILQLQSLLSAEERQITTTQSKVSLMEVLEEACNYIRRLNGEVQELSSRITGLMASSDTIPRNLK